MFFAYPLTFSLIVLLTTFTSLTPPTNAHPTTSKTFRPVAQSHLSSNNTRSSTLSRRIVYNPKITRPAAGDVWKVGSWVEVTWITKDMPDEARNREGKIILGSIDDSSQNEHLDMAHPLASSIPLRDGSTKIRVPDAEPGDNYVVVLFGDSGNKSEMFSIAP